jgi:mRNA interferase RelE/StbE
LKKSWIHDGYPFSCCPKANQEVGSYSREEIHCIFHELEKLNNPRSRGKGLKDNLTGLWRYRGGDYRIICQIESEVLNIFVVEVGHRKVVYG